MRKIKGFTLIELLVVVAIISVLIAMLLPALSSARDQAKSAICLSNERQIYLKFVEYFNEYNNELPPGYSYDGTKYTYWLDYIKLASSNWADVEKNQGRYPPCPSIPAKKYPPPESIMGGGYVKGDYPNFTYAMNLAFTEPWWKVHKIDRISRPSETLLIMDNLLIFLGDYSQFHVLPEPGWSRWNETRDDRHHGKTNILWSDGSISAMSIYKLVTGKDPGRPYPQPAVEGYYWWPVKNYDEWASQ